MRKLAHCLQSCISYIFIAVMLWIIVSVLFFDGSETSLSQKSPLIMAIVAVVLISLVILVEARNTKLHLTNTPSQKADTTTSKSQKIHAPQTAWLIFSLIVGTIIVLTALFLRTEFNTPWDAGTLYESVYAKLTGNFDQYLGYFQAFPFQLSILYFYYAICKIGLHFFPFLTAGVIMYAVNGFLVALAILFYVLTLRRLFKNRQFALRMAFFYIFATSVLLYTAVIYTDTASIFAVAGMLYLATIIFTKPKINPLIYLLFGCFLFIGFLFKTTTVIIAIAFLITLWLSKFKFSKKLLITLFLLVPFLLGELAWTSFSAQITGPHTPVPKTHWVMVGLKEHGGYNKEDYDMTFSAIANGEDANRNCLHEIVHRIKDYGPVGYASFLSRKISYTWGDGTYFISEKLSRSPHNTDNLLSDIFRKGGKYNQAYEWAADLLHLSMLFILLLGAFLTRKSRSCVILTCKLSIIGVFIFFLLWETRSRYLLNYTPLFFVLCGIFLQDVIRRARQHYLRTQYLTLLRLTNQTPNHQNAALN